MATLLFHEARRTVIEKVTAARGGPGVETVALETCAGRVLAEALRADRDSPAATKSLRDGYAVRAAEVPGRLRLAGEVRAGQAIAGTLGAGEAIEIMTGAPVPRGADAVLMVEHAERNGEEIRTERALKEGENILEAGAEAKQGALLLEAGRRIGFAETAVLAGAGMSQVKVYRRPRVAILATGDEIVPVAERPGAHQVRNSNAWSLAVQVRNAGGEPEILPIARDNVGSTKPLIERGLKADLLVLSGGVSAGKYDIVEPVLEASGAEFYFNRVAIQPGQPVVFGRARGTFFFGLPGNPASTMVTFEVLARAAVELLGGQAAAELPVCLARLTADFRHKPGLRRFLPAQLNGDGTVTPLGWRGSSDMPAVARANGFVIAAEEKEHYASGELIEVLARG